MPSVALTAPMTRAFVAAVKAFVAERGVDLPLFQQASRAFGCPTMS